MEAAYFGVYIWKRPWRRPESTEVDAVRKAVYGQEFLAPGGKIKMHENNHHTYKPVLTRRSRWTNRPMVVTAAVAVVSC